jgi:hypothetical protein
MPVSDLYDIGQDSEQKVDFSNTFHASFQMRMHRTSELICLLSTTI